MFHRFQFHLICERPLTGKDVFTLKIRINHQDYSRIIVHLPDDYRHGFLSRQFCGMMSPVPGYDLISALRIRACDQRRNNPKCPDALHRLIHLFIVQYLERMPLKGMQLFQRDFLHVFLPCLRPALFRRKYIIVTAQADVCAFSRHSAAPPLSAHGTPPLLYLSGHA